MINRVEKKLQGPRAAGGHEQRMLNAVRIHEETLMGKGPGSKAGNETIRVAGRGKTGGESRRERVSKPEQASKVGRVMPDDFDRPGKPGRAESPRRRGTPEVSAKNHKRIESDHAEFSRLNEEMKDSRRDFLMGKLGGESSPNKEIKIEAGSATTDTTQKRELSPGDYARMHQRKMNNPQEKTPGEVPNATGAINEELKDARRKFLMRKISREPSPNAEITPEAINVTSVVEGGKFGPKAFQEQYEDRNPAARGDENTRESSAELVPRVTPVERVPPTGGWASGRPGQREAGRQRPPMESPAPSEPVPEAALRSVFGTGEPGLNGPPRPGRLGHGENLGRQRELGPEAGNHLRNVCQQAPNAPENGEHRSWWGFFKQRLWGTLTLGIKEYIHAERFRRRTKETAEEVTGAAALLDQTRDMDIEQAQEEANRIRGMVGGSLTGGPQSLTTANILNIQAASNQIDAEKAASNARLVNRIVANARENVRTRLARYKNEFGDRVTGEDRLAQFEERLRAELASSTIGRGIREQSILKRDIDFKRAVRERLDPDYWHRYVYGGLETIAGLFVLKLGAGYLSSWLASAPATPIPGSGGEMIPGGMDRTIWNTATEYIKTLGVSDPSQLQILKASKAMAMENGIGVPIWNIPGNPLDIHMMQGFPLKVAATKALILGPGF